MRLRLDLRLAFATPLSTPGGEALAHDALGNLVLPGSSVKGVLRHHAEQVAQALGKACCEAPRAERMCRDPERLCPVCRVWGSPAARGPLAFLDLRCEAPVDAQGLRQGVAIDRHRRASHPDLLFERATAPDVPGLAFAAAPAVVGQVDEAGLALLLAAIRASRAWGGARSRGLGWAHATGRYTLDDHPALPLEQASLEALHRL